MESAGEAQLIGYRSRNLPRIKKMDPGCGVVTGLVRVSFM